MKKLFTLLSITLGIIVLSKTTGFAQANASATSSATIVTPISIAKTTDMNFGNVAVSGTAGTVILSPSGSRTQSGGVTLPGTVGTVTAAAFTVTGQPSYTYSISLPPSAVTLTSGSNNMTASSFTSTPSSTGTLAVGGTQVVNVGATLNVGASQPAGLYVSTAAVTVTVNYN